MAGLTACPPGTGREGATSTRNGTSAHRSSLHTHTPPGQRCHQPPLPPGERRHRHPLVYRKRQLQESVRDLPAETRRHLITGPAHIVDRYSRPDRAGQLRAVEEETPHATRPPSGSSWSNPEEVKKMTASVEHLLEHLPDEATIGHPPLKAQEEQLKRQLAPLRRADTHRPRSTASKGGANATSSSCHGGR